MIIWLLLSVLCFFLFKRFVSKIEIRNYGEWEDFKIPLYMWAIVIFFALLPVLNFLGLIIFEVICIWISRSSWGDTRFKKGKSHWLCKFIDLINKKF